MVGGFLTKIVVFLNKVILQMDFGSQAKISTQALKSPAMKFIAIHFYIHCFTFLPFGKRSNVECIMPFKVNTNVF